MSSTERSKPRSPLDLLASAPLPTQHGLFQLRVYRWEDASAHPALSKEHCALVIGDVRGQRGVPVRVHSECLTSEVFGSLKCDCREQFEWAQAEIARRGFGVLLYLRQEGRGIGLANKIRAYQLQDQGFDTVEANEQLGFKPDQRDYGIGAQILRDLGVRSMRLLTNNPRKFVGLEGYGLSVVASIPIEIEPSEHTRGYLKTKKEKLGHKLSVV
jgi:3,4-dihydroxy 2-butanone 4-phosphate synthase/GTP cyclohydrolase II